VRTWGGRSEHTMNSDEFTNTSTTKCECFLGVRKVSFQRSQVPWYESFAIHVRNMLDFLWPDKPKRKANGLLQPMFSHRRPIWRNFAQDLPTACRFSRPRRKAIAHPTYARLAVDRAQKDWDVRRISNEVTRVVEKFIRPVPMQFLGPKCTELKANIEADGGFRPCCI
jgi:hypothetical protein